MEISPVSKTAPAATPKPEAEKSVLASDFETFLQMLTAQARYQDPLEPLDSTEYAAQLAQFSTVEQQVKGNDLLSGIAAQLGVGNMAQFAGWIGMEARTNSPAYFDGGSIKTTSKPAAAADEAFLIVRNEAGEQVFRRKVPLEGETYEWNGLNNDGGTVPAGLYSFTLESRAKDKAIQTDTLETYSRVNEARVEGGKTVLVLEGGALAGTDKVTALRSPVDNS